MYRRALSQCGVLILLVLTWSCLLAQGCTAELPPAPPAAPGTPDDGEPADAPDPGEPGDPLIPATLVIQATPVILPNRPIQTTPVIQAILPIRRSPVIPTILAAAQKRTGMRQPLRSGTSRRR